LLFSPFKIFKLAFLNFTLSREALQAASPEGLQQSLQGVLEGMVEIISSVENYPSAKQYQPSTDLDLGNSP